MKFNKKKSNRGVATASVKNRVGKVNFIQKNQKGRVEKKTKQVGQVEKKNIVKKKLYGNLLLFTKHFDARTKLSTQSKKNPYVQKKQNLPEQQKQYNRFLPLNQQKTLSRPAMDSSTKNLVNKHQQPSVNNERQTIFTGKSIKVVTKNSIISESRRSPSSEYSSVTTSKLSKTLNSQSKHVPEKNFPQPSKQSLPAKVVVSNLHPNVTEDDIKELFGALGELRRASLTSLGSAEVIYKITDDAFAAYSKYHGRNLDGQPMILKITTVDDETTASVARSSRHPQNTQPHYIPPARLHSTKPVVFTVKL